MFKVVKHTKQLNEKYENTSVMPFTARESYEDARALAKATAKNHALDLIVKAPIEVDPGKFQFFTSNYTLVTYCVEKEDQMDLREELETTLEQVNKLLEANKQEALTYGVEPHQFEDQDGSVPLYKLLETKARLLGALAAINTTQQYVSYQHR